MKYFTFILLFLAVSLQGQDMEVDAFQGKQYGFGFALAESGASISGYYRLPVAFNWTAGGIAEFHLMRDEGQYEIPDYNGYVRTFNKQNNLFYISLYGEVKKRFLNDVLDSAMRPFWTVGGGGIYAMNYPEKRFNSDGDVIQPPDEYSFGWQATLGAGIDISAGKALTLSIRPQYRLIIFNKAVAGRKDHSAVEIRFEFGSTKPK
jgi:hypothetical protein